MTIDHNAANVKLQLANKFLLITLLACPGTTSTCTSDWVTKLQMLLQFIDKKFATFLWQTWSALPSVDGQVRLLECSLNVAVGKAFMQHFWWTYWFTVYSLHRSLWVTGHKLTGQQVHQVRSWVRSYGSLGSVSQTWCLTRNKLYATDKCSSKVRQSVLVVE